MRLKSNMDQDMEVDLECIPQVTVIEPPEGDDDDDDVEGERNEVKDMAMVTLTLLKQDPKVMLQQVKHLVKANPQMAFQVFTCDVEGWTPVHACALRGRKKVLKMMMQAGIDVNARMGHPEGLPSACTLLHIAANRQDRKVADYLVHHGAEVNAKDSFGRTPLFYATRTGNKDVIKLLADSGARLSPDVVTSNVTSSHHKPSSDRNGTSSHKSSDKNVTSSHKTSHKNVTSSISFHLRKTSSHETLTSSATIGGVGNRRGSIGVGGGGGGGGKSKQGEEEEEEEEELVYNPRLSLSDDIMTPEPKQSMFCFLPLPHHQQHKQQHLRRQQLQQQQRPQHHHSAQQLHHQQRQQQQRDAIRYSSNPHLHDKNGHLTS